DTALSNAPVLSTCYQLVTGSRQKDTAFIRLTVDGTDVTGTFSTSIYEKDTRKGTYAGTMRDSIVRAVWSFTQEGIKDSLPIEFKVEGNSVVQKRFSYDSKTGREFIADTSTYRDRFQQVACGQQ
ncbi:MAG: hypothetical protein H7Y03_01140, partial [Chitinophagaceae bacterium]|nr:hypothetical protein [Chitinophagaceae bacterium]